MQNLDTLRHSASHVLAMAVLAIYPKAKLGIGPSTENGFYYDFDFPDPISENDLPKIEKKMEEIIKDSKKFERSEFSISEALNIFKNQFYKEELIKDLEKEGNNKVTVYETGNFIDLCTGPHLENTAEIKAFKLLKVAGAYWRGSEKNKMLTRIYGTAFGTQKELEEYLLQQESAKENDHRKIGKELNLFTFSDLVGKGLPLFTPKGASVKRELERFIIDEELKRGYQHVSTPSLAKTDLYKTSGHYPYYKDTMYPPMKIDQEELILRPMTCPHHFMLFKSEQRSYRELPIKYAELASQFRYEKSGELTGLMRVRTFCLADSHIFCAKKVAKETIFEVLDLIEYVNKILGLEKGIDYNYRLSLGDRNDTKKYYKDDEAWKNAEELLRSVLKERKAPFYEAKNEAAFYGPKIDIQIKGSLGKDETAFTVQYDFVMPKRFDLKFINENGKEEEVIVIHRSSVGAIERTMAFLIEKYKGAFPTWLAPTQAVIIPISDKNNRYAREIFERIKQEKIRVEIDDRSETMQAKIRKATLDKIPYMIIIGQKEELSGKLSVRKRNGQDLGSINFEHLLDKIKLEIENKN